MKDFYNEFKYFYQKENSNYSQSYKRNYNNNLESFPYQEKEENINNNLNKSLELEEKSEKNEKNKNNLNNYDQALSLNNKFKTKNIKLEKNKSNDLFFYVPEENIQGLYTVSLNDNKSVKLNYLKHKRNNENNIENNNKINDINNNIEYNVDNILKNIFKNRKSFYADFEIRKNLNKEFYNKFIYEIAYKYNNDLFDVVEFNNYIYNTYKSLGKLTLSNISSCYLKERNITNANLYFSKKDIIIGSMFFLINKKISQIQTDKSNQEEIMFIGESGIGKTFSLYLYTYILRLNPFNLVISIFEINEFIENPILYLQKEIAFSLYYACANNADIDFKEFTDCLTIDKKMTYDSFMDLLNNLMSKLFEAYNNKLCLYLIIDGLEKAQNSDKNNGKELINKLITSLYNVSITFFGTENKEFLDQFKVIYFCNSDESNSDIIIKEKMSDFSQKNYFSQVNYSNFFERGIIFLEPESIYKEKEISYFIEKNEINKEDFSKNKEKSRILKNIIEYTDSNFKKILWLIKDNKIISKIKENKPVIHKYLNNNLEEWLYDTIFQFQKLSFEQQVKIYHFIYSCQNLSEMNQVLTQSYFISGFKTFNYSLIIPKVIKSSDDFFISFKLKNKNLTIFLKNLDMDKLYKKINLGEVTLQCLINEYTSAKSAILRGLILEEMLFVIFKSALKEKKILKINFNVQIYAKKIVFNEESLVKNNQVGIIISHIEKAMSREDDIFEKDFIFMNNEHINNNGIDEIIEENDGIYFLSHKFPCIDLVIKNGKNLYLIQIKKTLMFEHIVNLNADMHYFYLMEDENIFKELVRQNELKMKNNKLNTKLNFFLKLFKLHKKNYNFKFIFIYQAKESTLNINRITDESNIKDKFKNDNIELNYKLEDLWRGPIDRDEDNNISKKVFYINNDYFLKIKCKRVLNNILLSTLDNFTDELQRILKISNNDNFFSTLKE